MNDNGYRPTGPDMVQRTGMRLRNWRPGDRMEAGHLQESVEGIRRLRHPIDPARQVFPGRRGENGGATAPGYVGPFAGRMAPTESGRLIEIGWRRGGLGVHDFITFGLDRTERATPETIECTESGYVYYALSRAGGDPEGALEVSLAHSASAPGDSVTVMNILLGYAVFSDGAGMLTGWEQYQYGQITFPANFPTSDECEA